MVDLAEVEITYEFIQKAAQHPGVREQLQVVADRIASRARGLAASEDVTMEVTTKSGLRPKGRPYVNVIGDNAEQEWGSSRTGRRRILGRAAEGA